MAALVQLIANFSLDWIWLGQQISSTSPYTVLTFSAQSCATDVFFQTLAVNARPWTTYHNVSDNTPVSLLNDDTILILTDSFEAARLAITKASRVVHAFRAKYFLVQYNDADEQVIENLVDFAWTKHLTQVVVIRLQDRALYAVLPKCSRPRVIRVSAVQWPNLKKIDLTNCPLKIAASFIPRVVEFNSENDSSLAGFFKPFYKYVKAALKFQAVFKKTVYLNVTPNLMSSQADMSFSTTHFSPNMPLQVTPSFSTSMAWCVPDSCTFRSTTYFLWREFTGPAWALVAVSVVAITLTMWWFTPVHTATVLDSLFTVISTFASTPVKIPSVRVRWILAGWLLAMVVLSTAYQTVLHSMMAAPIILHSIEDGHDLLKSQIPLVCVPASCADLLKEAKEDKIQAELAARTQMVEQVSDSASVRTRLQGYGFYTTIFACNEFFKGMRPLPGGRFNPILVGAFGVVPSSWLAPALRQVALQAEASGFFDLWLRLDVRKHDCPNLEYRDMQPITFDLLWPAILLLCVGLSFAFIVFLTEIAWFWWKVYS